MRIAVSSTACNGKTRFINSFLGRWGNYSTPTKTYRDLIKEKDLKLNMDGSIESQKIIRDALVDQAIENASNEFCIHDRCILDNLVYTLWLAEKDKINDDSFVKETFDLTRETLKLYDIVLFLPLDDRSPVTLEEKDNRELDEVFRVEIDNIFNGVYAMYKEHNGLVFPKTNSPAMVEIFGDEDEFEKTDMVANYIDTDGTLKKSDESLVKTIAEMAEEEEIAKRLLNQISF